ncbi:substrate-binding domain-containing protein [uncultured Desulfuromonas sp.]|uniref:substrate-binding domain-containing protein n=1 Tax=uncultured Desulfuromonas sp. TaxID=181013 RepID=UPI002AAB326E|nr:substrate-binding domain-containing protein [uncultured Desulfuromonas sp.]
MKNVRHLLIALLFVVISFPGLALASDLYDENIIHQPKDGIIRLFGPGGPHSGYIKVAKAFEKATGHKVEVIFGPESRWSKDAQQRADIIFGSSEQSMIAYLENYRFVTSEMVQPLYIRPAVIVVQKGNPKNIQGFNDLLKPGMSVIVTEGKGVYNTSGTGVWEDVAGRLGSLNDVKTLRRNIASFEKGSGASFRAFKNLNADAWITWSHWPIDHADVADYVALEPQRQIYRVTNIAVSPQADPATWAFVTFLKSSKGAELFATEGWTR